MEIIETLNLKITQTTTLPPSTSPNTIYVNYIPEGTAESPPPLSGDGYDATVFAGILVIHNDDKIPPADGEDIIRGSYRMNVTLFLTHSLPPHPNPTPPVNPPQCS